MAATSKLVSGLGAWLLASLLPSSRPAPSVPPLYYLPFELGTAAAVDLSDSDPEQQEGPTVVTFGPVPLRTPIVAMESGKVIGVHVHTARENGDNLAANMIAVEHGDRSVTLYAHLASGEAFVAEDDRVVAGDRLGVAGGSSKQGGAWLRVFHRQNGPNGPNLPMRFAEAPTNDGLVESGQLLTSRNKLRVGPLADLLEVEEAYPICAAVAAQGSIGDELRRLADDAAAKRNAAAMKKYGGRFDLPQQYEETHRRLASRWRDDAKRSLANLDRAIAAEPPDDALLLARCLQLDFGGGDIDAPLKERIEKLRPTADVKAVEARLLAESDFRKTLGAAVVAERAARRLARSGQHADWSGVAKLYRTAQSKGAGREKIEPLTARIAALDALAAKKR